MPTATEAKSAHHTAAPVGDLQPLAPPESPVPLKALALELPGAHCKVTQG